MHKHEEWALQHTQQPPRELLQETCAIDLHQPAPVKLINDKCPSGLTSLWDIHEVLSKYSSGCSGRASWAGLGWTGGHTSCTKVHAWDIQVNGKCGLAAWFSLYSPFIQATRSECWRIHAQEANDAIHFGGLLHQ